MNNVLQLKRYELMIKLITWLFVYVVTLHLWETNHPDADYRLACSLPNLAFVSGLFLLNITVCCWKTYAPLHGERLLLLQTLSLLLLLFLFPNGIVIFLAIMLFAQLTEYVRTPLCFLFASLLPVGYFWQLPAEDAWFHVILFCLLNYFAMYVFKRMIAERKAKDDYAQLLRELNATQQLLSSTIKREERIRIARDLHDLLGHHLTALSLQLEVAVQLNDSATGAPVKKARAIAENLMQHVRDAVSTMRSDNQLDITAALSSLVANIEHVNVQLSIAPDLKLSNTRLAELILRLTQEAITNILKHSKGTQCSVQLLKQQGQHVLTIRDNGPLRSAWVAGNGLKGMAERVHAMDGSIRFGADGSGGWLVATIPEPL